MKFFIISYAFNLERRKYVAVLNFRTSHKEFNVYQHDIHIFINMIIWPLMTYTVTSFGKAFAHVRNCLLKKACYEIKILTDFTRKRHRRIQQDLCKNLKKNVKPTYSIFQHVSILYISFFGWIVFWQNCIVLVVFFIYSFFFRRKRWVISLLN